jgi:hypothetical protein
MTVLGGDNLNQLKMVRMLRLAKLAKLARLLKMSQFISNILNKFPISKYPVNMVTMVLTVTYLAHILGCANFAVARMSDYDPDMTWDPDNGSWVVYYQGLHESDFENQYIASVYWVNISFPTSPL